MLFLKFSVALLAPIAALAVPIGSDTYGKPQNLITIPGQSMPLLPPTTQTDLPSTASHDRRQTDNGPDLSLCAGVILGNADANSLPFDPQLCLSIINNGGNGGLFG
jgi:hypothetical protein